MTLQEALELLKIYNITTSSQMLRRWIRQGKIEATMVSKKEGYVIDYPSLMAFITEKRKEPVKIDPKSANYQAGFKKALETKEYQVQQAVKNREKELILKGIKEEEIHFSTTELKKGFSKKGALEQHFKLLTVHSTTLNVLGNWLYDDVFGILMDVSNLPYPNRGLKARVKKEYTERLFAFFESNK